MTVTHTIRPAKARVEKEKEKAEERPEKQEKQVRVKPRKVWKLSIHPFDYANEFTLESLCFSLLNSLGKGKNFFAKAEQKSDPAPVAADVVATETPVVGTPAATMKKRQATETESPVETSVETTPNSVETTAGHPTIVMVDITDLITQFLQAASVMPSGSETRGTTQSSEEILEKCSNVRAPTFQKLIKAIHKITSSSA